MKTLLTIGAVAGAAAAFAAPVLAQCGDGWMGTNLKATPGVKAALSSAYAAGHPGAAVGSPVPGHTYYGSYSGTRYAVATFGTFPTIFKTDRRGRWHVRAQTRGDICTNVVPIDLIRLWWLEHRDGRCFVEPS